MDYNDINDIDMEEMEKQRYEHIKKSGKYIELKIIIGAELEKFDGRTGKMPVVMSRAHGCGPEEIANMYSVLKNMVDYYEETYPAECLLAKLTMSCSNLGTIDTSTDEDEGGK